MSCEVRQPRLPAKALGLSALALLCLAASPAMAQDKYPSKPVRMVVPFAPGGGADIIARVMAEQFRKKFGQPFVIENKPGAFGIIGIEEMVRARHDGYTLQVGNISTNTITPILHLKKFKINYDKDVQPVTRLVELPSIFVATTQDFTPKTLQEMIAYAKQNPGKVRYSSAGVGSFPHYDMAIFANRAGIDLLHVPNQSAAAGMLKDVATGDAQIGFLNAATATPMIRTGQMRAYAVASEKRLPEFPDVPTMAELGYPGVGTRQWLALFAPSGIPDDVLATLHAAAVEALKDPAIHDTLKKSEMQPVPNASPADAKAWLQSEAAAWKKITDEVKVEIE
jgi:tripartite-type tricarboxylate transporter receptor subunit TctC